MAGVVSPIGFVIFLSVNKLMTGAVSGGLFAICVTSLERRFQMSSSEIGIVTSCYDIGSCVFCVALPYFLRNHHRPRVIAISAAVLAISYLLFAIPHYTSGPYVYGAKLTNNFCQLGSKNGSGLPIPPPGPSKYNMVLMAMACALMGIAYIPSFTIGFTFIEDNFTEQSAAICIGICNGLELLGIMAGLILGGKLLSIYVDFDGQDKVDLTPYDPRWVGAWWVGFIAAAVITVVFCTFPLSLFPRTFTKSFKRHEKNNEKARLKVATLKHDARSLIQNKTLIFLISAASLDAQMVGLGKFFPKYTEAHFNTTAQTTSILLGMITPAAIGSNIISVFIIKKYNMTAKQMIKFCFFCVLPSFVLFPALFLIKCPEDQPDVTNKTISYTQLLTTECALECNCRKEYAPVCGDDHVTYLSPCLAGCEGYDLQNKTFTGCRCVTSDTQVARTNTCATSCLELYVFIAIMFVTQLFLFMPYTPVMLIIMRIVDHHHRSVSLGLKSLCVRLLGRIPAPMIVGLLIDRACVMWQGGDENTGTCWIFDKHLISVNLVVYVIVIKLVVAITYSLAYYFCPQQKLVAADDEIENLKPNESMSRNLKALDEIE